MVDASDEPIIGAAVVPAGTTNGVLTDIDGNFTITISSSVKSLQFNAVGFKSVTLPVQDKMNVVLQPEAETLESVVVTGYGSGKKLGSMVGSVSVVGSEALENVTTPSFLDALQGKVAGLSVMSNSGDPSSTENQVRMRGVNSLNSSTTPLFILDGAPITQSVFSTLNPGDIESITVLKDAASVAIYGSRAANGVIVITSKKGKYSEKATVSIRAKYGWSQMTSDKTEMMNSEQYIRYRDLIGQPVGDDQRAAWEKYGIDTDWRAETFNGHAPTYSLEAAVTGGSETTNYYLSLNHMDMDGIIEQSKMRREAMRVNLSTRATNWLRIGFQGNFGYTKYQQNNESNAIYSSSNGQIYTANPMVFSRRAMPMDSPYYYTIGENGEIIWGEKAEYLHFTGMPTPHYFNQQRSVWRNRVTVNAQLFEELTPIEGLTLRAQQAVD
ncbi:MAG: TonB-dependent receptor plug domain-containing protein, partial [Muribaculaceae bacterium]|nr:TonB-dependent receptor plug domain-containing protein [Muribaculaceae bacterium]